MLLILKVLKLGKSSPFTPAILVLLLFLSCKILKPQLTHCGFFLPKILFRFVGSTRYAVEESTKNNLRKPLNKQTFQKLSEVRFYGSTPLMVECTALKTSTTDIQHFQSIVIKVPISVSTLLELLTNIVISFSSRICNTIFKIIQDLIFPTHQSFSEALKLFNFRVGQEV